MCMGMLLHSARSHQPQARTNTAQEDPFAEFKKVFEKFASAEQVTGAAPLGDDEDEERGKVR